MKTQKDLKKNKTNLEACICRSCPSYNDCSTEKKELLFCSPEVSRSSCNYRMDGCACGNCTLHLEYDLKSGYYCLKC